MPAADEELVEGEEEEEEDEEEEEEEEDEDVVEEVGHTGTLNCCCKVDNGI